MHFTSLPFVALAPSGLFLACVLPFRIGDVLSVQRILPLRRVHVLVCTPTHSIFPGHTYATYNISRPSYEPQAVPVELIPRLLTSLRSTLSSLSTSGLCSLARPSSYVHFWLLALAAFGAHPPFASVPCSCFCFCSWFQSRSRWAFRPVCAPA